MASSVSGASVFLQWAAPTTYPTASYVIEAGFAPGLTNAASFDTGNPLVAYSTSPVPPGTYYVRVRAHGVDGLISAASNETVLTVGGGGGPLPCSSTVAPPAAFGFAVAGSTVMLNWQAPSGGSASYVIEAGSAPGLTNLANFDTQSPATSYTATGVGAGTFFVRVRAKNACGASGSASNEVVIVVGR